ncbi:MAG: NAD(P)/FAD-dependent oxidoreductase [Planctomycetaceae bacterium]
MQPCAVGNAIVRDGTVIGVESDHGDILADFTIDAAGGRHWLANELHLPMQTASPQLLARYGYVEGDYAEAHDAPILKADAIGWTWIARVRERTYQWTRLSLRREVDDASQACVNEPPVELRALTPMGHTCGADVTWRCVSPPAGAGYFLCGDAAAVLDPASSHGVLKAVMSGIYAGHLVAQMRADLKSNDAAATEYSDWLTDWFRHDVKALKDHYSDMGCSIWSRR